MAQVQDHRDLVELASRGHEPALDTLFRRHLPGLLAYVRLHAGARLLAKETPLDLVQSACREVLRDIDRDASLDESRFRGWLYVATERKILDRARYHGRARRQSERDVAVEAIAEEELALLAAGCESVYTPSRHARAREELARLQSAFQALPEDYREVIALARIVGLSHAEIAQKLGRSEGAVRVLLHRALARLAHSMGQEESVG